MLVAKPSHLLKTRQAAVLCPACYTKLMNQLRSAHALANHRSLYKQPQRPTRTLRVFGDENAMPATGIQKTLHQRNKSSPALSTMANAGSLKLAAKRTAFGDVSNTINVSRPSKDDSAIGGKGDFSIPDKPIHTQQDRKTTNFLRPAQRPLSISGLKGLLSSVATNPANQPFVKHPLVEIQQPSQPLNYAANTRKVVTKKSTAIFKDVASTQPEPSTIDLQKPLVATAPVAPVHRELLPRPQTKQLDEYEDVQPRLIGKPCKHVAQHEPQQKSAVSSTILTSSEEPAVLRSDGIYIDEQGQVQPYDYIDPVELAKIVTVEKDLPSTTEMRKQTSRTVVDRIPDVELPKMQPEPVRKSALAPVSEPEEYWDDEGEENYDEEGYVTARSFKSRGENTTGGATTVLFPKVNQKAKKEIATAKDLIEGSKTAEELEDEAWDTTMVAEYGEEIFQYMKDLEVILVWLKRYLPADIFTDQDASQRPLHGQSSRNPMVHACRLNGLDRPSPPSLQPLTRDIVSLRKLH